MARALKPEHLQAAFQAMAWDGWTYEAAMADPARKAVVSWRARQICNAQAKAGQRVVIRPPACTGYRCTQKQLAPHHDEVHRIDLKRAAAGDRDD